MRISARTLATGAAVSLALTNVARAPAGTLGGRESPLILLDLVTIAVCIFLVLAVATRRVAVVVDRVMAAAAAFALVAAVSAVLAVLRYSPGISESLGVVAYLVRWMAYFAWYPFTIWALSADETDHVWRNFERAILAFCLFGIFQSAFLPGFAQMLETSTRAWDIQGRRLVSTVLDPNHAGILIVIALLVRLARLAEGLREPGVPLGLLATGLLLTLSRSSLLATVMGILVLTAARGFRLPLLRVFLAGGLLLVPFISLLLSFATGFNKLGVDGSAAQRLIPWTRAIILIRDHPWFGAGFNAIALAQQQRGWRPIGGAEAAFDGGLLFTAAMTGFVGLFFFVRLLGRVVGSARAVWRDVDAPPDHRAHASATAACIVAVVVHSLFVNSLYLIFVMLILWVMWGRLAHMVAARSRRLGAIAALPIALLAAGCDPCAGTAQCSPPEGQVAVTGAVVMHDSGEPVRGATVEGRFTGADGATVKASATTDDEGLWTLRTIVPGEGAVSGSFTIDAPDHDPYVIPARQVRRPARAGDAEFVGQWTETPYIELIAYVTNGTAPVGGATIAFERTGGVAAVAAGTGISGGAGNFSLYVVGPDIGTTVGMLRITHPVLGEIAVEQVSLDLDYRWKLSGPTAWFNIAPRLFYGGATVFLGTLEAVGGVAFEFVRTGGVEITPARFTVVSRPDGFFNFDIPARAHGDVMGDVTIRPPTGASRVYRGVRFSTSVAGLDSGPWGFGEAWKHLLTIHRMPEDVPARNVPVEFRRTSGLAIEPATLNGSTDDTGQVRFTAVVRDTGTVVGELVVTPAGGPSYVIPDVRLRTNPDNEFHPAGPFRFPATTP